MNLLLHLLVIDEWLSVRGCFGAPCTKVGDAFGNACTILAGILACVLVIYSPPKVKRATTFVVDFGDTVGEVSRDIWAHFGELSPNTIITSVSHDNYCVPKEEVKTHLTCCVTNRNWVTWNRTCEMFLIQNHWVLHWMSTMRDTKFLTYPLLARDFTERPMSSVLSRVIWLFWSILVWVN